MQKAWWDSSWCGLQALCLMSLVTPMLLALTTRVENVGLSVHGEKKGL